MPKDNQHIPIVVYFQHYQSFEQAYEKWKERSARVNYDSLYFIWEFSDEESTEKLEAFDSWNVRKLAILHEPVEGMQHAEVTDCYNQDPYNGKILTVVEKTGR